WHPTPHLHAILALQTTIVFVVALDSTILTLTLPTIAHALATTTTTQALWLLTAYLLASATIQPLTAPLSDILGRRTIFFASLLLFTTGTLICASAHTVAQMLAGRVVQGLGGGGILSVNLIILSDLIPLRHRARYVGIVQGVNSLAVNFGPLIGGAVVTRGGSSWRWVFYLNLPFCGVGLVGIWALLRYVRAEEEEEEVVVGGWLRRVDWVGSAGFVVGVTGVLLGVSWGGNEFAWGDAATWVPILGGAVVVALALAWERCGGARRPFLRLEVFAGWEAAAVYGCTVLQSLTLFAATYFLPLYLLTVPLHPPLIAGTIFLSYSFAVVPVSGITGHLITTFGSYKWAIFTGWLVNTLGLGAFMTLDQNTYLPGLVFVAAVAGSGQGLLFMAHQVAAQAGCKARDVGYASAMFSFARSFGFCLGIAIGGTIFQNFLRQRLSALNLPAVLAKDSEAFAAVLRAMPASTERAAIVSAYAWAFRYLWAAMCGISGVGFVLSFGIREHTLDVELDTAHNLV
ncbi:MFS general substrate transporter, partial [Teratosphaeria nubilosa]